MRVVVTGANGFIGTHTVRELSRRGYKVVALDVNTDRLREFFGDKPNLHVERVDIRSPKIESLISKGDKILHLAAVASYITEERLLDAIAINVRGTANVVLSAIKNKAERIVFSSTGSVYQKGFQWPIKESEPLITPPTDNYYGLTKRQAEDWIRTFKNKLPYVILRYGYIYGPLKDWGAIGNFIKHIKQGKPPVIFGGSQLNDFTHVNDVVEANILALETDHINETYNIGTGRATSILTVCEACIKALNADVVAPIIQPARTFDFKNFVYDISKAERILGYNPKWNLEKGIRDMTKD